MQGDIKSLLVKGLGKKATTELALRANSDTAFYELLLASIKTGEQTPAMKASWIIGTAARLDAAPAQAHAGALFKLLKAASIGGVQRELLKTLEVVRFGDDIEGEFVDYCFQLIRKPGIDVGIRYYCLRILQKRSRKYPELKDELCLILEEIQDWHNEVWKRHTFKARQKLSFQKRKK